VLAGNYAGYGGYAAHYYAESMIIEIPLNHSFNMIRLTKDGFEIRDKSYFRGIMLHELAHHYVHYHLQDIDLKAGFSTHTTSQWCYVCAIGWSYFDDSLVISPEDLARGIRKGIKGLAQAMADFHPYRPPYSILSEIPKEDGYINICVKCGDEFLSKRSDAKFCSVKCRVAKSRSA